MRVILAVLAIAMLAIVGAHGFEAALETAGEDHTITNETWTPTAGSVTVLDESNRKGAYYAHNVTVYDENDTEVDPGKDYKWFVGNGTIKALSGGELEGDANASITYEFEQTSETQREFAGLLSHIPRVIGLALPAFVVVILLVFLRGG